MFGYEKLTAYQKALEFNRGIYVLLNSKVDLPRYIKDQLGRASLSVMLNIAEGSGRWGMKDQRNFYRIARSSAFECSSLIQFLLEVNEIKKEEASLHLDKINEVSRMLFGLIKNFESENIKQV
jgi:four helix bundle protein